MRQTELLERAIAVQSMAAECTDIESFGAGPLGAVADFLHADNAVFLSLEPSQSDESSLLARAAVDLDVCELQDYLDHFHQHDPVIHFIQRSTESPAASRSKSYNLFRLADICSQTAFSRTKYYREFFKDTGIDDVLALQVSPEARPDFPVLIGFHRRKRNRTFDRDEMIRAQLIAPVLSSCLSRLVMTERLHLLEAATLTYVEKASSNRSVFVFDQQLNCAFQVGNSAPLSQHVLKKTRNACRQLSACDGSNGRVFVDYDSAETSDPMTLDIERAVSSFGEYFLVSATPEASRTAVDQAADGWGLTARETDVVNKIYQGVRNAEIATSLGISPKTVENHISSIFVKAQVGSRTELISRVATGRWLN